MFFFIIVLYLINYTLSILIGINFNTGIGQHILKNPLVVVNMVEKVCLLFINMYFKMNMIIRVNYFISMRSRKSLYVPELDNTQ